MSEHRHRHHTQSRARDFVSLVFSFFLSLALVGMMVLTIMRVGLVTKGGFLRMLDDQYYEYVLDFIEEQARYYTLPTGIDPVVLENVFVVDEVRENIDAAVVSAFNGDKFVPNVSAARDRLEANVRNSFAAGSVEVDNVEEADQVVSSYVDEIMAFYADEVQPAGLDSVIKVCDQYCRYYPLIMLGLVLLATMMVVLLVRLHHFVHRSLRYMAYAVGGAALMELVVPAFLLVAAPYKGLSLTPQYFYHFGVSLCEHALRLCMLGSAVLAVIMVVLIIAVTRLRKGVIQKRRHHRHRHLR